MKINIIGSGKLGTSIATLIHRYTPLQVQGIVNRSLEKSLEAIHIIGSGQAYPSIADLPPADLTLIAVGDDSIETIANELHEKQTLKPGNIIFHCSGHLSSNILKHPKYPEIYCASVHPLRSFASPVVTQQAFLGTYCALEGDEPAKIKLTPLFQALGAHLFELNSEKKSLYHAGCVFASNYLVTLAEQALSSFKMAGIDDKTAKESLINLMQGTLNNLQRTKSTQSALTGPLQRADIQTLKAHLEALDDERRALYSKLGLSTLTLCDHNLEKSAQISELFEKT